MHVWPDIVSQWDINRNQSNIFVSDFTHPSIQYQETSASLFLQIQPAYTVAASGLGACDGKVGAAIWAGVEFLFVAIL